MAMGGAAAGIVGWGLGAITDAIERNKAEKEAKRARKWQEKMAKNRYQYAVRDLRAAGLNPMLAVGSGMAPGAASGAVGLHSGGRRGPDLASSIRQKQKVDAEVDLMNTQKGVMTSQSHKNQADVMEAHARVENLKKAGVNMDLQNEATALELPTLRHRASVNQSEYGKQMDYIDRAFQSGGAGMGQLLRHFFRGNRAAPRGRGAGRAPFLRDR